MLARVFMFLGLVDTLQMAREARRGRTALATHSPSCPAAPFQNGIGSVTSPAGVAKQAVIAAASQVDRRTLGFIDAAQAAALTQAAATPRLHDGEQPPGGAAPHTEGIGCLQVVVMTFAELFPVS